MRMKPKFHLHPNESVSAAITRIYRHIRTIERNFEPSSHFASRIKNKSATRPKLRLVK